MLKYFKGVDLEPFFNHFCFRASIFDIQEKYWHCDK